MYTPLRYAHVGETEVLGDSFLPIEWVQIGQFDYDSGLVEYCVDYLDDRTEEAAEDDMFASFEEALRHATQKYGLEATAWLEGRPPSPN
jgi:hypothetical protein